MRNSIIFLIAFLSTYSSLAQGLTIDFGPIVDNNYFTREIFYGNGEVFFVHETRSSDLVIESGGEGTNLIKVLRNSDLGTAHEIDLSHFRYQGQKVSPLKCFNHKGQLQVLFALEEKKQASILIASLGADYKLSEGKLLFTAPFKIKKRITEFRIAQSENDQFIAIGLVYNPGTDNLAQKLSMGRHAFHFAGAVLNDNLDPEYQMFKEFDKGVEVYFLQGLSVSNSGVAYSLWNQNFGQSIPQPPSGHSLFMHKYSKDGIIEQDLPNREFIIESAGMVYDERNNEILVGGFYYNGKSKNGSPIEGCFFQRLSGSELQERDWRAQKLDPSAVAKMGTYVSREKGGIKDMAVVDCFLDEEGNLKIIGEAYLMISSYTSSGYLGTEAYAYGLWICSYSSKGEVVSQTPIINRPNGTSRANHPSFIRLSSDELIVLAPKSIPDALKAKGERDFMFPEEKAVYLVSAKSNAQVDYRELENLEPDFRLRCGESARMTNKEAILYFTHKRETRYGKLSL